jgi:Peptidase M50B-like
VDLFTEIWRRASSVQPAPSPALVVLVAVAGLALVAVPSIWPYTRMLVTITHEGSHAAAALLTGRRLHGIRLHSDTSGLTVSSGRPSGPGMVLTLVAGYLGPAIAGLAAVGLLIAGHGLGLLWLLVIMLGLMALQIRNFYGFAVVLGCGAILIVVSWYLSATAQSTLAYLLTWVLLIAAPKPVLELIRRRRRGQERHSDADQLARLTQVPAPLWAVFFLVMNSIGLIVGAGLLLPALMQLAVSAGRIVTGG